MTRLLQFALVATIGLVAAVPAAAAGPRAEYASAWLGERLRQDQAAGYWRNAISRPAKAAEEPASAVRSWVAGDENPWANAYGTPASGAWRSTLSRPGYGRIVRVCSCYLPADARSWDGGPLTQADITRLCTAQCF